MTTLTNNSFLAALDTVSERNGNEAVWLTALRRAAQARFAELGLPSRRHEDWRYTDIAPLSQKSFSPVAEVAANLSAPALDRLLWRDRGCARLVFVNGRFAAGLSALQPVPDGVTLASLAWLGHDHPEALEPHLGRHAGFQDRAFVALNTALMQDGAVIEVPAGVTLPVPVHVVHVVLGDDVPRMVHPRNLIVVGESAGVQVIETYLGTGRGACLTNTVTEVLAGANAQVEHYKLQRELDDATHVGFLRIRQGRDSRVRAHCVSLGARLARHDVHASLEGPGGDCTLHGLYAVRDRQHVDNHLRVEHVAPHCDSREIYKGVLDGRAHGVFTGRIFVHPAAQKTDAKQSNHNLMLAPDAQVDTKPQLEIFADDVKCTHGATIGQIDRDALFYLRTRGLPARAARGLLVHAFARESIDAVRHEALRRHLHELLIDRLPDGDLFKDLE